MKTNIALFGFMGVGKSEVGRILAEKLNIAFTDLDDEIVKRTGKSIAAIFEEEGEASFRELERAVVREASALDGLVIACGGGAILDDENLRNLRRSSVLILLTADPKTIMKRVGSTGGSRPLLYIDDRLTRIKELLSARNSLYLRAADIIIDTSHRTPEQVAGEILSRLKGAKGT